MPSAMAAADRCEKSLAIIPTPSYPVPRMRRDGGRRYLVSMTQTPSQSSGGGLAM